MRPFRRRISCTVDTAGDSSPPRSKQRAILRAPQAGWASRTARNLCLSRPSRPRRACVGTPRAIGELPIGFPAAQPLVTGVRVDPEPPAQLAPVHPLLHCQPNKLTPLIHDRHLAPRHGWPPCSRIHAMMICRPCPRTPVGDVSGLYNEPGHPRLAYAAKTWMPGTRPGMTTGEARLLRHEGLE